MGRPPLTARRQAQTRLEIAQSALELFARDGYDNVTVDDIAEEAGISLRTFYRYFSAKEAVLSPLVANGTKNLAERIARRPDTENLATAVQRAVEEISPSTDPHDIQALIRQLDTVPALQARWLNDLRIIEETLVPIVQQRAADPLSDVQARLSAAAIVTCLRVALELSTEQGLTEQLAVTLGNCLAYVRDGAAL
jgi:AcrR family transcriptional regulator